MDQVRPLTSLSQDELIARIEQYIVVVELRDAEIRELHAANSALLAERDALRDVLDRIVSYYDMLRHNGRMPSMAYQAASDHENTMFGQARILLAKEQP